MNIGEMIFEQRKKLNLTLEEVGNAVGVSKSTVKKWETGYIANMRRDKIALLAKVLQLSPADFIYNDNDVPMNTPKEPSNIQAVMIDNVYKIPVYDSVSAGFGAYACDEVVDYMSVTIDNPYDVDDTIAIRVTGDSMFPTIENGDTIIVRKQESVDSGSIAVVLLDGEEGLVKTVKYGVDWIELHSTNPYYPVKRFEGEEVLRLRVVGKVVGLYKSFI